MKILSSEIITKDGLNYVKETFDNGTVVEKLNVEVIPEIPVKPELKTSILTTDQKVNLLIEKLLGTQFKIT